MRTVRTVRASLLSTDLWLMFGFIFGCLECKYAAPAIPTLASEEMIDMENMCRKAQNSLVDYQPIVEP